MFTIDLNCDMGEGIGNDDQVMPFISSANIACGFHAGNEATMKHTMELAIVNNVAVGAHPSFFDRENFGRTEKNLRSDEIYDLVLLQLRAIDAIARKTGCTLRHVKPHGALYNMSARAVNIATAIALAVKDFNEDLILFGLSGSLSIREAKSIGLQTASEIFADRNYDDDGSLIPRSNANALVEDIAIAAPRVVQMIKEKEITSVSGKKIPVIADTVCIHGDGKNAVEFAGEIYRTLKQNEIAVQAFQG